MSSSSTVITPKARFSYVNIWQARAFEQGDNPKFTITLIFNKSDDLTELRQAHDQVIATDFPDGVPYGAKDPFLVDGAVRYPNDPYYADKLLLNCSQSEDRPPQVVDATNTIITDKSQLYSGCFGHAMISFYGYFGGSKGVSCSIHGVMKTDDGENLGGESVNAQAGFAAAGFGDPKAKQFTGSTAGEMADQTPPPPTDQTPPPPAAKKVMTAKATTTYEAYIAKGWTDASLIENGYMEA